MNKDKSYEMFNRIAPTYDFLNHLLSAGQDYLWRRELRRQLEKFFSHPNSIILDMATGTGDLAFNLCKIPHVSQVYGIDLSQEMLNIAEKKIRIHKNPHHQKLKFMLGDAMDFSWPSPVDAITMSFGIRNVVDAKRTLINFKEKLRPGGRLYILEFAYPEGKLLRALYLFYFRSILPRLGALISQDKGAYQYLFESVKEFPKGQEFASLMEQAGLNCLLIKKLSFGIVHLYVGEKAVL